MAVTTIDLSSLDGSDGFRMDGAESSNDFSYGVSSVSNAGDINGDGFDDVMIGFLRIDHYADPIYPHNAGVSYVVFGKASGFSASLDLTSLNGSDGFVMFKSRSDGMQVSSAGDINGDGVDDFIVSAPYTNIFNYDSSVSYVVFGKTSGFNAGLNLGSLDGNNGFRLDGASAARNVGDVNGDGFDDVIIGVVDDQNSDNSSNYVIFGKSSGFDVAIDLSSLNGSNGFRLDKLGKGTGAGDINGDGFDDVIIGTWGADDPNGRFSGSSYVVFGKASGFGAAFTLSGLDGSNGFRLDGESEGDLAGSSVRSAGDFNGDGFDDVLVGAPGTDFNGDSSGSSYMVFGKATGFNATMNLSEIDGINGFRLDDVVANDGIGSSVSGAGDVNGDGFDDIVDSGYVVFGKASGFGATVSVLAMEGEGSFITGAGDVNNDGFDDLLAGGIGNSTYVVLGSGDFVGVVAYLGTSGDDILTGTSASEIFNAGDGNDTMVGGGGTDVFKGNAGDDTIQVPDFNFQLVEGGAGSDILGLDGSDLSLHLASVTDKIKGIEAIDLTGRGDNTLELTVTDILKLSDTSDTLTVNGNAGDRVIGLGSGWADGGIQGDFHTFIQGTATLLIDVAVNTDFLDTGTISLSSLDGNNGFRLDGTRMDDRSGVSVSAAGDFNGDGYDDVIIGASGTDPNGSISGSSYLVFGKASGFPAVQDLSSLDGNNGFRLDGVAAFDRSGNSVSAAGDVNADGFDDVIVGATADPNGEDTGSSYVVFGQATGFDATLDLSDLDGGNGFRLDGVGLFDNSGRSVSNAGDVNGDGFDDVIVGALLADSNGSDAGSSYVVFGQANGFDATMDLSDLDGGNGFRLDGAGMYDRSGYSVSAAGDVNGDGFDDVIVGADAADPNGLDTGSSYVVFGQATGFDATMDLSDLDGSNGFRLDGVAKFDYSGRSVSDAGDFNGDGYDDLIVGAYRADPNGSNSGSSYVVFGQATGFDATMDLSSLNGNNGFRLDGMAEFDNSGLSVSTAGDVNGDGFDDVIVGARGVGSKDSGSSFLVFGKSSGFSATMNLSDLNGNNGLRLDGVAAGDQSGASVSSAGDVNGDGFYDVIIGAPGSEPNGGYSGSSYIIFGRKDFTGGGADFPGTPGDDIFTGTSAAESFEGGDGNDRMIGRGGADSFDGGAGNDYIRILGDDFQHVDGGTGTDTLGFAGSGFNLDLSSVIDNIHGIETIALYGVGDNTLTLTAQDVIDLSETTNTLKIKGNTGDSVVGLSSGWTDGGVHGNFHTYTQGDAVLLIGVDVTTDFPMIV
ncbi:beta strand repeat-containing protein [Nitrosomonas ureae]|uniref:FG-GAP repeat-containing protein n=1 Tax=Nitrosomonas ureae TaxID=44577 RepID=A0A286AJW2_9PROT|nr:FG-GAP repeat protein [Nitrosomonas ureae]SOD22187.1 FG-GAP repeat-containing protein [Nitrosomonas ureae]